MNIKLVLSIIVVSILIGIGIFTLLSWKDQSISSPISSKIFEEAPKAESTPSPKPTLPPLDKDSNLEEEIDKLTPEDFSESFNTLKQEL